MTKGLDRKVNIAALEAEERERGPVVHACPPEGQGTMPCCGNTPFEIPRWHRMTLIDALVTCGRS